MGVIRKFKRPSLGLSPRLPLPVSAPDRMVVLNQDRPIRRSSCVRDAAQTFAAVDLWLDAGMISRSALVAS